MTSEELREWIPARPRYLADYPRRSAPPKKSFKFNLVQLSASITVDLKTLPDLVYHPLWKYSAYYIYDAMNKCEAGHGLHDLRRWVALAAN